MAPHENKSSLDLDGLLNEIGTISKFLKAPPVIQDPVDIHLYATLDRHERFMRLFLDYFLPKNLFPEVIEEDLAYLLAYNLVDVVKKEKLTEEWYKKRGLSPAKVDEPYIQFDDGTEYRSVNDLLEADSLTFGEFLPLLLKKMLRLRKFIRDPLTLQQATRYLDNIWLSWKPKLSKNDIKVILHLDASPFKHKKEIAKVLNLHENSITYIFNRLQKLCRFGVYGDLNESKLGLQKILVKAPTRATIEFPYLVAVQELRAGNVVNLYSFNIPRQRRTVSPIRDLYNSFNDKLDEFTMYQVVEKNYSLSFQYFDVEENKWAIDWDAFTLWLERILYEEKYYLVSPDTVKVKASEEKRISFDLKDLKIIDYYQNNLRMSMAQLSKLVGMSRAAVRYRANQLRDGNVLIPVVMLQNIGLDEQIVVEYTGDEEYLLPFESALFELPVVFSLKVKSFPHSSKTKLLAWLKLPLGSFIKFTDAVASTLRENDAIWTAHRYQFRSCAKLIPIEMFDEHTKKWRWDKDVLAQLTIEK